MPTPQRMKTTPEAMENGYEHQQGTFIEVNNKRTPMLLNARAFSTVLNCAARGLVVEILRC
jgi:hypothetical protein